MVSYELGKELRKIFFRLVKSVGRREKNSESLGGVGDSEFFLCPTLVTRRKNIFLKKSDVSKPLVQLRTIHAVVQEIFVYL